MSRAGGPASSAAGAVMQTGRAACACKGVGQWKLGRPPCIVGG